MEYLITVNTTVAFCDEEIEIYIAKNLRISKQNLDEDEDIEIEAWTLDDLMKMVYTGVIKDGKTVAALSAYAYRNLTI